jgi:hypothetical protein
MTLIGYYYNDLLCYLQYIVVEISQYSHTYDFSLARHNGNVQGPKFMLMLIVVILSTMVNKSLLSEWNEMTPQ